MSSTRPMPPSVHLTPAQRAALLHQTSPTLTASPPSLATPTYPQLPPTGVLYGRSPSGHILPKRNTSKAIAAQPQQPMVDQQSAHQSMQQPQQPHSNGTMQQHNSRTVQLEPVTTVSQPAALGHPVTANDQSTTTAALTPTQLTPSTSATASPASSNPHSPSSPPQPHPASFQRPSPLPSSSPRVTEHQQPLIDALYELIHAETGVGHWQGLTTQKRKDIATQLCREHLFNPQPGNSSDSRTTVQWQAVGSWTEYDVWVTCVRTVSPYYQGDVFTTKYTAHFDQVGRLVEFDETSTKGKKTCVVQ